MESADRLLPQLNMYYKQQLSAGRLKQLELDETPADFSIKRLPSKIPDVKSKTRTKINLSRISGIEQRSQNPYQLAASMRRLKPIIIDPFTAGAVPKPPVTSFPIPDKVPLSFTKSRGIRNDLYKVLS